MMSSYIDIQKRLEANLREMQRIQERRALLEAPGRSLGSAFSPVQQGYASQKELSLTDISLLALRKPQGVSSPVVPPAGDFARMLLGQNYPASPRSSQVSLLNRQESFQHSQDALKILVSTTGREVSPLTRSELWNDPPNGMLLPSLPPPAETFPFKLHRMLRETEEVGKQAIISFSPCGNYFYIHDTDAFTKSIIPHYFVTLRLASFQRQLNLYGFTRVSHGTHKHCYFHPFFLRDRPQLCARIKRKPQTKGSSSGKREERVKAPANDSTRCSSGGGDGCFNAMAKIRL